MKTSKSLKTTSSLALALACALALALACALALAGALAGALACALAYALARLRHSSQLHARRVRWRVRSGVRWRWHPSPRSCRLPPRIPTANRVSGTGAPTGELSPFAISSSSEAGWVATATLAGSRLRTDFKGVPHQIETFTIKTLAP